MLNLSKIFDILAITSFFIMLFMKIYCIHNMLLIKWADENQTLNN